MIHLDFNAYILRTFLQILTNYYTLSKIVKIINKKKQKFYTIKITSLKKIKVLSSLKSLKIKSFKKVKILSS